MSKERNTLIITQKAIYNDKELTVTRCGPLFHMSLRSTVKNITAIPDGIQLFDSVINMFFNADEILQVSDHIRKELAELNKETS